jgi:hypothetical protein
MARQRLARQRIASQSLARQSLARRTLRGDAQEDTQAGEEEEAVQRAGGGSNKSQGLMKMESDLML